MITTRENSFEKKVLTLGLLPGEKKWLEMVAQECHFQLETAKDEIDLANRAEFNYFDLFILGQTKEFPDLSYMTWLLKGLCNQSHVILVYTDLPEDNAQPSNSVPDLTVITRPYDLQRLYQCIYAALQNKISIYKQRSLFSQFNPLKWFR